MEKQKITITLLDVMEIDTCLNGAIDELTLQRKGEGLLSKNLSIPCKYLFGIINDQILKGVQSFTTFKNELIIKYGDKNENDTYTLEPYKNGETNEKIIPFYKEYNELLTQPFEVEFYPININQLSDIKDTTYYGALHRFFTI